MKNSIPRNEFADLVTLYFGEATRRSYDAIRRALGEKQKLAPCATKTFRFTSKPFRGILNMRNNVYTEDKLGQMPKTRDW